MGIITFFSLEHARHSDINILGSSPGMPVVVACLPISLVAYEITPSIADVTLFVSLLIDIIMIIIISWDSIVI